MKISVTSASVKLRKKGEKCVESRQPTEQSEVKFKAEATAAHDLCAHSVTLPLELVAEKIDLGTKPMTSGSPDLHSLCRFFIYHSPRKGDNGLLNTVYVAVWMAESSEEIDKRDSSQQA